MVKNMHHLCYTRREWEHNSSAKQLREFWYCHVLIPQDTLHAKIHRWLYCVPCPPEIHAESALRQLKYLDSRGVLHEEDDIEKRLSLLLALFECTGQPTEEGLRLQLSIVRAYKDMKPST